MKKILLLIVLIAFITVLGFSQADQPAAVVNLTKSEPITVRQLRVEVERMEKAAGKSMTQAQRLEVLDVMINERLALQAAERDKITLTENELNEQIQQLKNTLAQQLGRPPTDAEYAQAVRNESGLDVNTFKEQLRRQLITQKLLMAKKGTLINSIKQPTEQEIVNQYNLARTQLVRPETVRISMIQVPYGPDAASRRKAKELADRLSREIGTSAAKFDEVSSRGQSPDSEYQAGDAGYLPRNMEAQSLVGAEFLNTAFSLKQGEVSKLIEGNPGFQIIKITENHAMKTLELNDIYQLGTRVTVREYIGQYLLSEKQQETLTRASQELVKELRAGTRTVTLYEQNIKW